MVHQMPVAVTKHIPFRHPLIDVDGYVSCFPGGRVEFSVDLLRVAPGKIFRIDLSAVFLRGHVRIGISRQASFFTNSTSPTGVPAGGRPYTGQTLPPDNAIRGVNDFEPTGGVRLYRNL